MRKQKHYVILSEQETRVLLKSLIRFRNKLVQQGRNTDVVDALILKIVMALKKEISFFDLGSKSDFKISIT